MQEIPPDMDTSTRIHAYASVLTPNLEGADESLTSYFSRQYKNEVCLQAAWYNAFGQIKHIIVPMTNPVMLRWLVSIAQDSDLDEDWFPGEDFLTFVSRTGRIGKQALFVVDKLISSSSITVNRQVLAQGEVRPGAPQTAREVADCPVELRSYQPDLKRFKCGSIPDNENTAEARMPDLESRRIRQVPLSESTERAGPSVEYVSSLPTKAQVLRSAQESLDTTLLDLFAREPLPPDVALPEPWARPAPTPIEWNELSRRPPARDPSTPPENPQDVPDQSVSEPAAGEQHTTAPTYHQAGDPAGGQGVDPPLPERTEPQEPALPTPPPSPHPAPPSLPVPKFAFRAQGPGSAQVRVP